MDSQTAVRERIDSRMVPAGGNPWAAIPRAPAYVLPSDKLFIDVFNKDAANDLRVRCDLVPEPFFGPFNAPVVVLLLNPGVDKGDVRAHADRELRDALMRNLLREDTEMPHVHLHPDAEHPGAKWWKSSAKALSSLAQQRLAERLLAIEYFPYHSATFGHGSLRLPSQEFSFELVRRAIMRDAVIVMGRGRRLWFGAVPELANCGKLLSLASERRFTLSSRNLGDQGFEQLCTAIET